MDFTIYIYYYIHTYIGMYTTYDRIASNVKLIVVIGDLELGMLHTCVCLENSLSVFIHTDTYSQSGFVNR